jgi:hypothetical protein
VERGQLERAAVDAESLDAIVLVSQLHELKAKIEARTLAACRHRSH